MVAASALCLAGHIFLRDSRSSQKTVHARRPTHLCFQNITTPLIGVDMLVRYSHGVLCRHRASVWASDTCTSLTLLFRVARVSHV